MEPEDLLIEIVERVIDDACIHGKFNFDMYDYLTKNKLRKIEVTKFIESSSAANLSQTVDDLEYYLEGGHPEMREAYPLSKPDARKVRNYLYKILEDAWKYELEKGKRRRRKTVNK